MPGLSTLLTEWTTLSLLPCLAALMSGTRPLDGGHTSFGSGSAYDSQSGHAVVDFCLRTAHWPVLTGGTCLCAAGVCSAYGRMIAILQAHCIQWPSYASKVGSAHLELAHSRTSIPLCAARLRTFTRGDEDGLRATLAVSSLDTATAGSFRTLRAGSLFLVLMPRCVAYGTCGTRYTVSWSPSSLALPRGQLPQCIARV
jgi:hypothetical protein